MTARSSLAWHVSLAGRALSRTITAELDEHDLGRGEYRVLFALTEQEGITQSQLVDRFHLDKSAIARVVAQLADRGYVEVRPDPEDSRRNRLYLTAAGRRLQSDIARVKERVETRMARGLTTEQRDALVEGLRTVVRNLGVEIPARPE
ncbi:MAG: MarR family winged helix-turn-helix transcriptional regulator [Halobacteriales archaeon]